MIYNMKTSSTIWLLSCLSILTFKVMAQTNSIWVVDIVQIKNGLQKEADYYYSQNWKPARDRMLAKKFIKSYKMVSVKADSAQPAGYVLMTEFADSTSYGQSEARFQTVFKELRPDDKLKLLNDKQPGEFRQVVTSRTGQTIYQDGLK